jgi:hypothetical protein
MYLKNLNNRLDDYFRESVTPQLLELITEHILDYGYKFTDLENRGFEDEIETGLGAALHNFHVYVDSSIEVWISRWNEKSDSN